MKINLRYLCLVLISTLLIQNLLAQTANNYTFSTGTGASLEDFSSGGTTLQSLCEDDVASSLTSIGFNFVFEGTTYTQFSTSSNGLMRLGGTQATTSTVNSDFGTASGPPVTLCGFWDDLWLSSGFSTSLNGKIQYKVTGTSPNKILKINYLFREYDYWDEYYNYDCGDIFDSYTYHDYTNQFQIWLYESDGKIEFIYGSGLSLPSGSCGIAGSTNTNYLSVNTSAHTASNSSVKSDNTAWPGSGRYYRFTACTLPSISSHPSNRSICLGSSTTLSVTASPATAYQWQYSADNSSWANVANGTPTGATYTNATSATLTIDASSTYTTKYYRCVVTNTSCSSNSNSATVDFHNCGSAYGIYTPASQSGMNISNCEIYATAGGGSATGCSVCTTSTAGYSNVNISGFPVINAGDATNNNANCTSKNMNMYSAVGSPTWTSTGSGGSPASGSGATLTVQYSSTGYKDVVFNGSTYEDFNHISITAPSQGTIVSALTAGCPGAFIFESSLGNLGSMTYAWTCWGANDGVTALPGGVSATFSAASAYNTGITFTNTTGSNQTIYVQLIVTSDCCGPLTAIRTPFTIYAAPSAPTLSATSSSICTGNSTTLTASAPANCTFSWYSASSGGSYLGSGSPFSVTPGGTTTYYANSLSSDGCLSNTRTPVTITVTPTSAPTVVSPAASCGGTFTLSISSPIAGATYSWFTGSCNGSLQQASSATSFDYSSTTVGTTNIYVSVQDVNNNCNVSSCASGTVTVSSSPTSLTWTGTTNRDWHTASNWGGGCIPNCGTTVTIPNVANDPIISFNASGAAACAGIDLQNGAVLKFADAKAELEICGDFTHSGVIDMDTSGSSVGKVTFKGSSLQKYTRNSTGTGEFYKIIINNTGGVKIMEGTTTLDMVIRSDGSISLISGNIFTEGGKKLYVKNSATSAMDSYSSASYVAGRLMRAIGVASYDFPIGNSDSYQLMNIEFSNTDGVTEVLTEFSNTAYAIEDNYSDQSLSELSEVVNGVTATYSKLLKVGGSGSGSDHAKYALWTITPNTAGTPTYSMTLYGKNFAPLGADKGYTIVKRNTFKCATHNFLIPGTFSTSTYTSGTNTVMAKRTGISGFSQASVATTTTPLPVDLKSFNAVCLDGKIYLKWITLTELNSKQFKLEYSKNGKNFQQIGYVEAAGTSNTVKNYQFVYTVEEQSQLYFKLSLEDIDGTIHEFDVISNSCNQNTQSTSISFLPNPTEGKGTLLVKASVSDEGFIKLYDVAGRLVEIKKVSFETGINSFNMDLSTYAPSVYLIEVVANKINLNIKIERR